MFSSHIIFPGNYNANYLSLARINVSPPPPPPPGIQAPSTYYKFENTDTDTSGSNALGYSGGNYSPGVIGNCLDCPSSSSMSLTPNIMTGGTDWSISYWIRINSGSATDIFIVDSGSFSNYFYIEFQSFAGTYNHQFHLLPGGTFNVSGAAQDTWQHVVVSNAGTTMNIYLNGTLATTVTGKNGFHSLYFNLVTGVKLDELGCFDVALSADDALNIYNGGAGKQWNGSSWV